MDERAIAKDWRLRARCGQQSISAIRSWLNVIGRTGRLRAYRWPSRTSLPDPSIPLELVTFETAGQVVAAIAKEPGTLRSLRSIPGAPPKSPSRRPTSS